MEEMITKDVKRTRTLFLGEDVNGEMAEITLLSLRVLSALDVEKPILLHINSWGGNMDDCGAIVDAIRACPAPVYTVCFGPAYSAAAMILALGQPGHRAIVPHGCVMFHSVKAGSDYDLPKNIEGHVDFTKKQFTRLSKEICACTAFKYRDFKKAMNSGDEIWLTAYEAKEKKVVDIIWTTAKARQFYKRANTDIESEQNALQEILALLKADSK